MRDRQGEIVKWFASNTDIHDQKRAEEAQRFLVETGATLGSSPRLSRHARGRREDGRAANRRLGPSGYPEDGKLRTLAVEHVDDRKIELALELSRRYPEDPRGRAEVRRTFCGPARASSSPRSPKRGLLELAVDDLHLGPVRELGFQSYMGVPLVVRDAGSRGHLLRGGGVRPPLRPGRPLLSPKSSPAAQASPSKTRSCTGRSKSGRRRRSVLETVGDGVFLIDLDGVVRLWNRAAESITKLSRSECRRQEGR